MSKIYEGDIGTKIRLNAGSDITSETTCNINYIKPDGTTGQWTAEVEDTNYAYHTTIKDDLDVVGVWQVQLYVVLTSWTGHGEIASFQVHKPLAST